MDIDHEVNRALARINRSINISVQREIKSYNKKFGSGLIFRSEQEFTLVIRDLEHFYKIVRWCNKNIGHGMACWTCKSKVRKYLDPNLPSFDPPAIKKWVVYIHNVDISPLYSL